MGGAVLHDRTPQNWCSPTFEIVGQFFVVGLAHASKSSGGCMTSAALLRYDAARRVEANVDRLCREAVMVDDRAAITARAILSIVGTSRSHVEALRAIAVYLR